MRSTVPVARVLALSLLIVLQADRLHAQPAVVADEPDFLAAEPDLRAYVEEALDRSPSVHEALARYRAALQRVPQVTALPDPVVTFNHALRSVETRVGPQRNSFMISQAFPWFGTLDLQGQMARQSATARYHLYTARQRDVIAEVKQAYYNLAYVDQAVRISEEEQSLLEHYEALAETRYATGQGLQQAVIKLQAEITKVMNRLEMLAQQRTTLAARLNTLRDRPPENALPSVAPLSLPEVTLDLAELYTLGDLNRDELQAATALIEGAERSIERARKEYWPTFNVSAGFANVGRRDDPAGQLLPPPDDGKNPFTVSIGLTLPLWTGKYRAGVQEAADELVARRHSYTTVRNDMEFSVRDAVVRIQTLEAQIDLFETALIPQAEAALRATEAAYETGQLGVLDLLDSERVLLDVRLIDARYSSDYLVALAQLERAIGTSVPHQ